MGALYNALSFFGSQAIGIGLNRFLDTLLGNLLVNLWRAIGWLPLPLLHMLGACAGRLSGRLAPRVVERISLNLQQAGLAEQVRPQQVLAEMGKGAAELGKIWFQPSAMKKIEVRGWAHAQAVTAQGKGILYLTPHLGCFELTARWLGTQAPITVLYRPPRKNWLKPLAEKARAGDPKKTKVNLASADLSGVRKLARALKAGETIGLLPDQVPGQGDGVWAPFFGRMGYTMTLPAKLQQMTDATILLTWGERLPHGKGYIMHIEPLPQPLSGSPEERAAQINQAMESLIRRRPEQYLWSYNRYKTPAGITPPSPHNNAESSV